MCAPTSLAGSDLEAAVQGLNVKVAMTVNTMLIKILLRHNSNVSFIEIQSGLRIQVLPDVTYLPRCRKHQFAAFITDPGILIVWDDKPDWITGRIEKLETELVKMVWGDSAPLVDDDENLTKRPSISDDQEKVESQQESRRVVLVRPIISAATLTLTTVTMAVSWKYVAIEMVVNRTYVRAVILLAFIPQAWLALVRTLTDQRIAIVNAN